jgi:hypothetical protein
LSTVISDLQSEDEPASLYIKATPQVKKSSSGEVESGADQVDLRKW